MTNNQLHTFSVLGLGKWFVSVLALFLVFFVRLASFVHEKPHGHDLTVAFMFVRIQLFTARACADCEILRFSRSLAWRLRFFLGRFWVEFLIPRGLEMLRCHDPQFLHYMEHKSSPEAHWRTNAYTKNACKLNNSFTQSSGMFQKMGTSSSYPSSTSSLGVLSFPKPSLSLPVLAGAGSRVA